MRENANFGGERGGGFGGGFCGGWGLGGWSECWGCVVVFAAVAGAAHGGELLSEEGSSFG